MFITQYFEPFCIINNEICNKTNISDFLCTVNVTYHFPPVDVRSVDILRSFCLFCQSTGSSIVSINDTKYRHIPATYSFQIKLQQPLPISPDQNRLRNC